MKLRTTACLFLLALLISACGGASSPVSSSTSSADESNQTTTANTSTPTKAETGDLQLTAGCTVVSQKLEPAPTQVSLFPPVDDQDWIKGAADAEITLIEYGDFQ